MTSVSCIIARISTDLTCINYYKCVGKCVCMCVCVHAQCFIGLLFVV